MKSKTIIAAAILFLFSTLVFAQEAPKDKDRRNGNRGMMGRMNFTDEQRTKMEDYRLELQKKQIKLKAEIQTARIELKQLLNADKIDKAVIEKKLSEISKIQIDQKMNFISHWEKVNQMLTPEQKEGWKKVLKRIDSPMKQKMMRRGMRDGRFHERYMRGPGRSRGEIPEFETPDNELTALFAPEFNIQGFDDEEEFAEQLETSSDELFEIENCIPELPEINPPDNVFEK